MARSRKKNPICGITCCESEKLDKRFANRRFRRRVNQLVQQDDQYRDCFKDAGPDLLDIQDNDWQDTRPHWEYPLLREMSNICAFGKDGKQYAPDWSKIYRK